MTRTNGHPLLRNVIGGSLFLAAAIVAALVFLKLFSPAKPPERLPPNEVGSLVPMDRAMSAESVRQSLDGILDCGSRFLGQPGFYQTEELLRKAFADAGLTVMDYPQRTLAPLSTERMILGADAKPLPGVEVYPFMPNHFQPAVTPPEGIEGTLVLVSDEVLLQRETFRDCIAVIDAADPPENFSLSWVKYAQLGFEAVIVADREGLEEIPWDSVSAPSSMSASVPVNFVRLAASKAIFDHLDERVTLQIRSEWQQVPHNTLVGYWADKEPRNEALIITSCYDAASVLPDRAPGVAGAVGVAAQLAALQGLSAYQDDFKRDVIFISYASQMMAQLPADRVTALLGPALSRKEGRAVLENEQARNSQRHASVQACQSLLANEQLFASAEAAEPAIDALSGKARELFDTQVRYVLNTVVFELSETLLQRRVDFLATGENANSPEFKAYQEIKREYDLALANVGYPLVKLVIEKADFISHYDIAARCRARFTELDRYHTEEADRLEKALALNTLLAQYDRIVVTGSYLTPADPEKVETDLFSFAMGNDVEWLGYVQAPVFNDVIQTVVQRMDMPEGIRYEGLRNQGHNSWAGQKTQYLTLDARLWNTKGYPAAVFMNTDRLSAYGLYGAPVELPYMRDLDTIATSLRAFGRTALSLVLGNGTFEKPAKVLLSSYGGNVYVANVGGSMVPNYPLQNALVGNKGNTGDFERPGYYRYAFFPTNPYGEYNMPLSSVYFAPPSGLGYSPEAAGFGRSGEIALIKDEGIGGQAIYKSMNLPMEAAENVNIVVFRASPVSILDLINPQSLSSFTGIDFITRDGLAKLDKFNIFFGINGIATGFLPPDQPFFVTLKAGSAENDLVQTTRAFILNNTANNDSANEQREIDGLGFLPFKTNFILDIPLRIARSMQAVNGKRLALQNRYNMADERVQVFHQRSLEMLQESQLPGKSQHASELEQRDAATYAILNHPVLRQSISEAIVGILWYLGLLVPFVFFFEKLAFGFPDIRKQLAAQAVIFLVVFLLLRLLHPAFQMIRSSLMILLGFVIMLISGGITVLFSGKFQENLEELRARRGQVTAAEVNTLGVMGTAFALGLNNMHRRIVRTGLTCATLVLITFAMICFTSVQSDVVSTSTAIGKAPYQGLLIKREKMIPIASSELFALQTKYAHRFTVAPRYMLVGVQEWTRISYNPEIEVVYESKAEGISRKIPASSVLTFDTDEPLQSKLEFLAGKGWFTEAQIKDTENPPPVMISDAFAELLGVRPEMVETGEVEIVINGKPVVIHGIFKAESLAQLNDLDGRNLLPFDIEAMRTIQKSGWSVLAEETDPRLGAERMILAPTGFSIVANHAENRLISVAVVTPNLGYKDARSEINQYLEQSGQTTYYGLDQVAYRGKRAREKSFAGLIELLIPLIIAAMTVLNTMRGSVYERRDEIFVYNAVGIAPRYIFAMFFSEAFVYAVVGSVLGYILSQGTGRILTLAGWTGGLNMTFTSINTIYASFTIMVAVFISTLFPARSAMEIAAPAEESGWDLPEPEGDDMHFALPFTFDYRGRIAVLAFFERYFSDHGEGSAGRFFASVPEFSIAEQTDPLENDGYIPLLSTTVWLKPFDLGVSQQITIAMPVDEETGEYIARITLSRLSGSREAWLRLNYTFVSLLRKHFLFWRAVTPEERNTMFEEARAAIESMIARQEKRLNG